MFEPREAGLRPADRCRRWTPALLVLPISLLLVAPAAFALTPIGSADVSSDVTVVLDATTFADEDVAIDDFVAAVPASLGSLPAAADLSGYHLLSNGDQLLAFDITVDLPGGVIATPRDVVLYDGTSYSIYFDGSAEGLPVGVSVDAVAANGPDLLLSFDTTVELGGTTYADEDVVSFNGGAFAMMLDGSAVGLDPALDVDAVTWLDSNGHIVISLDGSGSIGGVDFDDEDALEYDFAATWEMAFDGSAEHAALAAADLDAVNFVPEPGPIAMVLTGAAFLVWARRRRSA